MEMQQLIRGFSLGHLVDFKLFQMLLSRRKHKQMSLFYGVLKYTNKFTWWLAPVYKVCG